MTRTVYVKCAGIIALIVFILIIVIWLISVYRSALTTYQQTVELHLAQAVETEFDIRVSSPKAHTIVWFKPYTDTSAYVTKTIQSKDTTIYVRFRKDDPTAPNKLLQFVMQYTCPLSIYRIDSLFKCCMVKNSLPFKSSYVEYLDLKKNIVIESNIPKEEVMKYNIISSIDTLDIVKTIGIKVYVKASIFDILKPVMFQFIISVALVIIGLISILKLTKDILRLPED